MTATVNTTQTVGGLIIGVKVSSKSRPETWVYPLVLNELLGVPQIHLAIV